MTTVEFDVELFEQRLTNLKDTQDGIQQMSSWCLQQRAHHKKIVSSWLNVLKQVRVEHRLTLFYLANDVIQYSKRKNYEFVESWGTTLQKATTMVRDEKVRNKIFRIFKIWEQREIYSEEYLADLNGLLSLNPVKKQQPQSNAEPSDEYQNTALISNIRDCVRLGSCTDKNFKKLPKAPICDTETIKNTLKDRTHSEDVEREIDEFVASLETYIKSLKSEIKCRKSLINNIEQASTFYTNQRGEVKVVVNAYKNFGNRIKVVKKKLEELTPNLPSPIPSPDINAPSPEQDADIVLPDENNLTTSMFKSQTNGYTSYMDGNLPFDINDFKRESPRSAYETPSHTATQPIQVISSRSEEKSSSFDHTDYYKPVMDSNTYVRSNIPLPVPPVSNYPLSQSNAASYNSEPVSYGPDAYDPMTATYTSDSNYIASSGNNNYDNNMPNMSNMPLMPPPPMPPLLDAQNDEFNSTWDMDMTWTPMDTSSSFNHSINTPVSPPHFDRREGVNSNHVQYVENVNEELIPLQDVDHRQLHIPPAISIKTSLGKEKGRFGDVDHRNLISLTGSPGAPKSLDNRRSSDNNRRHFSSKLSDKDFRNFVPSTPLLRTDNKIRTQSPDQDYRKPGDTDYRHQNLLEVPKEITPIPALTMITPVTTTITPVTTIVLSPQTTPPPDSGSPNSLETPPLLPPLEPPAFPKIGDFLTPPPNMVDTSMPPPNFSKDDIDNESKCNEGSSPIEITEMTALTPNDIVETIDMELSDDDFEDFMAFDTEEISNQSIPEIGEENDNLQNDVQNDDVQNDDVQNEDEQIDDQQNDDEIISPNYDSDPQPSINSPPDQQQQPNFKVPLLRTPSPEFSESFHQLHQQHQQHQQQQQQQQHHHHQQQQQQQQQQHQQQHQQHQQQHRQPQSWDNFKQLIRPNTNNNNNNGNNMPNTWNPPVNNNLQNAWKPPRMPMPGMLNQVVPGSGMPPPVMPMPQGLHGMQGNQSFPRGPLFSPQRNFSPQMRPNFRGSPMRPRGGSPYFNNRGRGGMRGGPPQMGSRGNFRGKSWQ